MNRTLEILLRYREAFFQGAVVTSELFLISCFVGTIAGCVIARVSKHSISSFRRLFESFSFSISAIPALVLLFWLHFPLQAMFGLVIEPFYTAAFTLTLLNTLAVGRIVLEAMDEFPNHYLQAAQVCGMNAQAILKYIEAPILMRLAVPRWIDQQVLIFHSTIFAGLISVEELFRVAQRINATVYDPISIYSAMALIFFSVSAPVLIFSKWAREHFLRKAA